MRSLQLVGFIIASATLLLAAILLAPVTPDTPASAAAGSGMGIIFFVIPALGLSTLLLLPSSIAILWRDVRRNHIQGPFWYGLWIANSLISTAFLLFFISVIYFWITAK